MLNLPIYDKYNGEKRIAMLDNSTIAFMEQLENKGYHPEVLLQNYDVVFVPKWVLEEVEDSEYRSQFMVSLVDKGVPICVISEKDYSSLVEEEELNLYWIVHASVSKIGAFLCYLRRNVEKRNLIDLEPYEEWIQKMYDNWPLPTETTANGRIKKKNAGEISLTILTEIFAWYYPETELLTVYTQDADSYDFQKNAEERLKKIFKDKSPLRITYKSNDAILCQLYRSGRLTLEKIDELRKDCRKVTYTQERSDHSVALEMKQLDNAKFLDLIQDSAVQIIF